MQFDSRVVQQVREHPYPLLFATISGAHLYGFPSPDSDYDIRGVHLMPARDLLGLYPIRDTVEVSGDSDGLEVDLVTHEARKFFGLLLKKNGYVLEQLYSPLIVHTTPEHSDLKQIARGCITRFHAHHYLGFAQTQWDLWSKERPRRVKPLLYVYRVLLTGIHLMRAGEIEANLLGLNEEFKLPYIDHLVERKRSGPEQSIMADSDVQFHEAEYQRLREVLEQASNLSHLPENASAKPVLNDLLLRLLK